jgi:MFS transporter, FSR family, fosmidomycin resistance protein
MTGNGLQILFGVLADRGWRKPLLVGGVALAGAVVFVPWTSSYTTMFVLVLVTYIGSAAFHPAGTGSAGSLSRTRTGVMIAVFLAGGYAGYSLSQIVFSALYEVSARLTLLLLAVPLGAALGIALRVPATPVSLRPHEETRRLLAAHRTPLLSLFLVQVFATAINLGLIFLLPDLMLERHAPGWMVRGGGHFALVLGGCLSLIPAGHAADRWGARRVLLFANTLTGVLLYALLARHEASAIDLALVAVFGALNGVNGVVAVAEGNRMLPGLASGVSALLMGLPWCFAATASVVAGALADPTRGGTPTRALTWLALVIPLALAASFSVRRRLPVTAAA